MKIVKKKEEKVRKNGIFKKQKFVYKKPEELFRDFMPLRYNEWYKAWQTTHDHEINLGCIYDEPINLLTICG